MCSHVRGLLCVPHMYAPIYVLSYVCSLSIYIYHSLSLSMSALIFVTHAYPLICVPPSCVLSHALKGMFFLCMFSHVLFHVLLMLMCVVCTFSYISFALMYILSCKCSPRSRGCLHSYESTRATRRLGDSWPFVAGGIVSDFRRPAQKHGEVWRNRYCKR